MANEMALDKIGIRMKLNVMLAYKVEKKFRMEGDAHICTAYIRSLEESTRDVSLTEEDFVKISKIIMNNNSKRLAKRKEQQRKTAIRKAEAKKAGRKKQ